MKVGDLVTYAFQRARWTKGKSVDVGLIVEKLTAGYLGNADVKVLWAGQTVAISQKSSHLKVIDESW